MRNIYSNVTMHAKNNLQNLDIVETECRHESDACWEQSPLHKQRLRWEQQQCCVDDCWNPSQARPICNSPSSCYLGSWEEGRGNKLWMIWSWKFLATHFCVLLTVWNGPESCWKNYRHLCATEIIQRFNTSLWVTTLMLAPWRKTYGSIRSYSMLTTPQNHQWG